MKTPGSTIFARGESCNVAWIMSEVVVMEVLMGCLTGCDTGEIASLMCCLFGGKSSHRSMVTGMVGSLFCGHRGTMAGMASRLVGRDRGVMRCLLSRLLSGHRSTMPGMLSRLLGRHAGAMTGMLSRLLGSHTGTVAGMMRSLLGRHGALVEAPMHTSAALEHCSMLSMMHVVMSTTMGQGGHGRGIGSSLHRRCPRAASRKPSRRPTGWSWSSCGILGFAL